MTLRHNPIESCLDLHGIGASAIRRKVFGRRLSPTDPEFAWWEEYTALMRRTVERRMAEAAREDAV
jgi:hypothetical protein